jgi:hypothetical protein
MCGQDMGNPLCVFIQLVVDIHDIPARIPEYGIDAVFHKLFNDDFSPGHHHVKQPFLSLCGGLLAESLAAFAARLPLMKI